MNREERTVYVLGAGFSRPAGLPLSAELLPLLEQKSRLHEMSEWLASLRQRVAWLDCHAASEFSLSIEQVFHLAYFDAEILRLRQHLSQVGRYDGETPWGHAQSIMAWLSYLEWDLVEVIHEKDDAANLQPILLWAKSVGPNDSVITFNYDTLPERALSCVGQQWNLGFNDPAEPVRMGVTILKLHGSIDWLLLKRDTYNSQKVDLLFQKTNRNAWREDSALEEVACLCRIKDGQTLKKAIENRDLNNRAFGLAGLGAYKELHRVPGLGAVWTNALRAIYHADRVLVIGFSMSDFDAMAQMQFAAAAMQRAQEKRPLRVSVIDPSAHEREFQRRFHRVFRRIEFIAARHESFDFARARSQCESDYNP